MKKNILAENMQRFRTKNLSESNKQTLTEEDVYSSLKKDKSPKNIAKHLYNAKGYLNDDEAHVVAAFMAIPNYATLVKVSDEVKKLSGKRIFPYMNTFIQGSDLTNNIHAGTSVRKQMERIYKREMTGENYNKKPWNMLNWDESIIQQFQRRGFKGGPSISG
jgi:hypothetical protein